MSSRFRRRLLFSVAAIGSAVVPGGCVPYPLYPADPAYGYGAGYYGGGHVSFGGGWHDWEWHDGD